MSLSIDTLGIIAGSRSLPLMIAREARKSGIRKIAAIAFEGETSREIEPLVDSISWLRVGQLNKMVGAFQKAGVTRCVMAGQIAPRNLFEVRPDLRAMMMLFKLKEKNAHTIFGAIADELAKEGITLIEATPWLRDSMPSVGYHTGPNLSKEQKEDVDFGFRIAKEISRLEIGQTVVVKDGVVLAVEGFEGTDKCLARGGQLAGSKGSSVAVKVAKKDHDMRFDIPCVGAQTVEVCRTSGIEVLAVEAEKTIILEREEVEEVVRKKGPALVAIA
jgi:UDP-2,3-diacylglucosamine hydrolase